MDTSTLCLGVLVFASGTLSEFVTAQQLLRDELQMVWRDIWGCLSAAGLINAGEPAVGEELSTTQGETPGYECPPDCWSSHMGGDCDWRYCWVLAKIVSHPFMPTLM